MPAESFKHPSTFCLWPTDAEDQWSPLFFARRPRTAGRHTHFAWVATEPILLLARPEMFDI